MLSFKCNYRNVWFGLFGFSEADVDLTMLNIFAIRKAILFTAQFLSDEYSPQISPPKVLFAQGYLLISILLHMAQAKTCARNIAVKSDIRKHRHKICFDLKVTFFWIILLILVNMY